jgi:tight adherence protein C
MLLLLLLGLFSFGLTIVLIFRAVTVNRVSARDHVAEIEAYGFSADADEVPPTALRERADAFAGMVGDVLVRRFRSLSEADIRTQLRSAGVYRLTARKFVGYRMLATIALPLLWAWLSAAGSMSGSRTFLGIVAGAALGWFGPVVLLKRRIRFRLEQIDYDMPELIDVLVTTVEAGVGLSGSLELASRRLKGPLGDELRLATQEQAMGLATNETLTNLLERADTPAVRSFVRAVLQGETLGVSIGKIMRDLALEMRKRRRQAAEERAQKAPTKMLFPLIFLIFPAMFVVLLGPALLQLTQSLK